MPQRFTAIPNQKLNPTDPDAADDAFVCSSGGRNAVLYLTGSEDAGSVPLIVLSPAEAVRLRNLIAVWLKLEA